MAVLRTLPARSPARPRDTGVDLVRVLGVLAVVAGHTWTEGVVRDATFPWHVPVFFVLTGYLWRRRPLDREIAARAAGLLRPYLLWLVVAAAAVAALVAGGLAEPVTPVALLWGGSALGGPLTSFWFVTALFTAAVLYAVADRFGRTGRVVAAVVALVSVAAAEWLAMVPLSVGVAIPALLLVEAGRLLRHAIDRPPPRLAPVAAGVTLLVFAAAVAAGHAPQVDLKIGAFDGPYGLLTAFAVSVSLVVLAHPLGARLGERPGRVISTAACALVPVVLLHPVLLALPVRGGDGLRYLIAVVVPLAVALLLARTRLSGWALGR